MTHILPAWAVLGVLALLINAIVRLTPRAIDALSDPGLTWFHITFAAGWTGWMLYAEGYRGFQGSFAPRVAARAAYLRQPPSLLAAVLGPAYAMGLFGARRRTMIVAWVIPIMVVALILIVSQMSQPWRGLIDLGVVAGLGYGSIAIALFYVRAMRSPDTMQDFLALPEPTEAVQS